MTRLSSSDLETIRKRPQQTKLYMSIFQPQVVMKCRVNDASIAREARVVAYDTVSQGSYTNVEANFTMWVGSTDGAQDLGKVRVRSATSSQFTVSENSDVNWQNTAYLTIYKYVELWPIFPRIINDPANIENTLWYKDYDIPYSNQNTILGTYICMGPNRATLLDPASNQAQLYYTATGTYNLVGTSLNYNWTFEGGTPSSSSQETPGYVNYATAGNYVTRLQISGSNGSVDTSYRYVHIHDANNPPIQKWELMQLAGSRDEGGYTATFKVFETIPIQEFAVVVLFSDNYYGSTHQSFGGNYPNGSNIFWTGYIDKDTIQYDYLHSEMTFDAGSVTQMMKKQAGFAISVGDKAAPAYWYELLDLDGRRCIYHYLRWHTTAMQVADFQFVGTDQRTPYFDSDRESMYDAIDNYMRTALIGKVVSDRQGKVWMEQGAEAYPNPTGSFTSVMDISKRDWMNEPSIDERLSDDVSYIEMGGVQWNGASTGTFAAYLAGAPGNAPGFRGTIETIEGLTLASQSQLNTMAGNVFANRNSPYPTVNMEMAGNYTNLDIAPQEGVQVNIAASDTVRNISINGLYIPSNHTWKYYPQDSILLLESEFKQLVNGFDGQTIVIPPTPSDGGITNGFNVPGIQIPPIPPLAFPPFTFNGGSATGSSCCDYFANLGIGEGVYCCLVIRNSYTTTALSGLNDPIPLYDYTNNLQMYEIGSNKVRFLNSGTMAYNISLEADYIDSSNNTGFGTPIPGQLTVQLYNSSGGIIGGIINVQCNAVYQSSGHATAFETVVDSNLISPNHVKVLAAGGTSVGGRGGAGIIATQWLNVRFHVCKYS